MLFLVINCFILQAFTVNTATVNFNGLIFKFQEEQNWFDMIPIIYTIGLTIFI